MHHLSPAAFFLISPLLFLQTFWPLAVPARDGSEKQNQTASDRKKILFNDNWRFRRDDPPGLGDSVSYEKLKGWLEAQGSEFSKKPGAPKPQGNPGEDVAFAKSDFDDSDWEQLSLPHDWAIKGPYQKEGSDGATARLRFWGPVWYRKHFGIDAADAGKKFYLDMDGAMSYSEVWLNGKFVGGWPYGYASFRLDLTPFVAFGQKNVLSIRLNNPKESSRWYPGGGIYRNVWLVKTAPIHVGHWGTYVTTSGVTAHRAAVKTQVKIDNDTASDAAVVVRNDIFERQADGTRGRLVASQASSEMHLPSGQSTVVNLDVGVAQPQLWSLKSPSRYVAVTYVQRQGEILDIYETPFGIRTVVFDPSKGLLLNGEPVKMHGVCNHHDLGALGAALNVRALERQLEILKEMGCNAIRTSHNPPAPELLALCDQMGFLVMDESFDCWVAAKRSGDYHQLFSQWHEKDLRAQIRRDRNHPSVVMWSIGNEIAEQENPAGHAVAAELAKIVHEEDATRPVTAGCHVLAAGYNGFEKNLDVMGYNYKPKEYGNFHQKHESMPVAGSETASCISSRGEYFFPVSEDQADGLGDFQMSSYDLYAPPWATSPDVEFEGQDRNKFVVGEFVWTGFDYLGEPTPYESNLTKMIEIKDPARKADAEASLANKGYIQTNSRSSYFGILDLAGFKKDRFYLYQARWRPDLPMAHILPHWNWPERVGLVTPVHVYTSGDEAELFLNGVSLGRKKKGLYQYRLRWDDVVYQPGELKVIAYKNGAKWSEDSICTSGEATKLVLQVDRSTLKVDLKDLVFVTCSVNDKDGHVVPRSSPDVSFSIDGPGEIVATDNGDATDQRMFHEHSRTAFNGLCLAIVRAKQPGVITLRAQTNGLQIATVQITGEK